jgi:polysaccharide chain length determinant protein (PEP-CTERM system associated)
MWRFRWLAMVSAWVFCLLGWMYIYSLPDVYESRADVYVDTTSATRALLGNMTIGSDVLGRVNLVTMEMTGRPRLEKVAREVDLHLGVTDAAEMAALITKMRSQITIRKEPRMRNRYRIAYQHQDPTTAHTVVTKLLDTMVEDSLGANRLDTQNAQEFLREELQAIESELESSETRLAEFKRDNIGRMPGSEGGYFQRLQTAMTDLAKLESDLQFARKRRDTLQAQLEGERPVMGSGEGPLYDLDQRILENQTRLEEMQLRFTDLHPDVIAVKSVIEQLKRQKAEQAEELASGDGMQFVSDNPVFQSIQMELSKVDVDIATLLEQKEAKETNIVKLQALIDVLPQTEAELKRLNRDYEVKQAQYTALLQRLEVAELSESAEEASDIQFRIIDPPTVPYEPSAPPRTLLILATMPLGLIGGIALAFVSNLLKPVFSDSKSLRRIIELPVIGTISAVQTHQRRRRQINEMGAMGVVAFSLCLFGLMVYVFRNAGGELLRSLI